MNIRKTSIYLLGGLLLALSTAFLLIPFKSGAAGSDKTEEQTRNSSEQTSKHNGPPNYDAFASSAKRSGQNGRQIESLADQTETENGRAAQFESRLDVPTFLWASKQNASRAARKAQNIQSDNVKETTAREYLGEYASHYRLKKSDISAARLAAIHDTGSGAIIVKFNQKIGDIEVFRDSINVIMNRNLELVALSGYLTGDNTAGSLAPQDFKLQPEDALARAIQDLTGSAPQIASLQRVSNAAEEFGAQKQTNPYVLFKGDNIALENFTFADQPSRVKKVMFHLPEGYVPAYYVETSVLVPSTDTATVSDDSVKTEWAYSYVISAADGQVLFRNNLIDDARADNPFSYRVWADPATKMPYDTPAGNGAHPKLLPIPDAAQALFVAPNDVTLANYPFSRNDPWLAPDATETVGNNVDAFVNLFNPDGYGPVASPADPATGDFRAKLTAPNSFLNTHTPDSATLTTAAARQAGVQQLFYNVNFLHDWFYDAGFDETAGNAQASNYGRGGLENDSILAQAQDISGTNNANMLTPADGGRPRLRMYIFDSNAVKYLDVQSPSAAAGQRSVGTATFGAQSFDVTNRIIYAAPTNGCTALTNAAQVAGKFVMIDMSGGTGSCSVGTKINNGMNSGAAGYILVNSSTQPNSVLNVSGSLPSFTIPFLSISWNSAAGIKTQLAASQTVTARMRRELGERRDGSVDAQLVAHEWGHYISNRLIGDANGLNTNHAGGLGEGWGDFHAMLLTVRAEDTAVPSNANWEGAYALATYATSGAGNDGYYYGIRRYPYSTDMTKNPLTFKHITDGEALPNSAPLNNNAGTNSEVHNTGEVWAAMLWEAYASLLRDTQGSSPRLTFRQAQDRMKNYLVAAYKMTPVSPTLLEARDALIAAAAAGDPIDAKLFGEAFAKRGAGLRAVAPDRYSLDNAGLEESFVAGGDLALDSVTVDDSVYSCDSDGIIDNNEQGKLTVRVRNTGGETLSNPTVSLAISNTGVTSLEGLTRTLPPLAPNETATVTFKLTASGLPTYFVVDFAIAMEDAGQAVPGQIIEHYHAAFNYNETANASAEDDVESVNTVWTTATNTPIDNGGYGTWRRVAEGLTNHYWHGPDLGAGSEQSLVSPQLSTGPEGFTITFRHRFWFEFDGGGNYDGGVIEVSTDGGATWTDVGASLYNGTITNYGASDENPLKGRPGFVQQSASYPNFLTYSIDLTSAAYQNQSNVKIRFRLGSDSAAGAQGWDIDDIFFTGLTNTPFPTVTANTGVCCPLISFTSATLPTGSSNAPYSVTLTPAGGEAPYSFDHQSTLPTGLSYTTVNNTLVIGGTPSQTGSFPVGIDITDANGCTGTVNYTLVIEAGRSIGGTIAYAVNPSKFVSGATVSAVGTTTISAVTNSSGAYLLENLTDGGNYTVTPSKTGSVNGITTFDATLILRCVAAGVNCSLTAEQQIAADTDSDSVVTAFDALLIMRFMAASGQNSTTGQVGNWKFSPAPRPYNNLNADFSIENYKGFLIGEVDGDWNPGASSGGDAVVAGGQELETSSAVKNRSRNKFQAIK